MLTYNDLHKYQKREIIRQIKNKYGYLFLDTGMGKTVISLAIHDQLKKRGLIKKSLVICPKNVMLNVWRQEAKLWEFSKDFSFSVIHGSSYNGNAEQSRLRALTEDADIFLINYEGLKWLSNFILRYGTFMWQCVFYDESTKMKRSTTKRFKAFKQMMPKFNYRYCLTGTPIPNGLEDIFGQAYVTDQGKALGKYITHFRNNYMVPLYQIHGRVAKYGPQKGAKKRVAKRIAPRVSRLKKTDHLKIPELKYHDVVMELPPSVLESYKELEREMYLELKDGTIESFSSVATNMKLRQFCSGRIYDDKNRPIKVHDFRLEMLKKIKLDGNCIVAYNFKFERDDIKTVTGNSPFLDSRTSDKESEKWITGWNNYEFRYFLVNPASAAFGLNLQAGGNNVIWYSLTYNAEHYSQLIDRLWRQGQRKPVNVYHLIFQGTMDEIVSAALQRKDMDQYKLMEDIVNYLRR